MCDTIDTNRSSNETSTILYIIANILFAANAQCELKRSKK